MGCDDKSSTIAIDFSVGGLVWVRRRNGSWWPGRIVSLDEVNEKRLVSPRAGMPVKLLGRSDASVDWYNLEKSKRVKPFRCGEFDAVIKVASAAAANSNKKAVKYARREDAILHALEIENFLLGKDPPDVYKSGENSCIEQSSSPEEAHGGSSLSSKVKYDAGDHAKAFVDDSDSEIGLSQSGISFEEPKHLCSVKVEPRLSNRRKMPNGLNNDSTEGTKRMRGIEDLGMGVVLQQVNEESSLACDSNLGNAASCSQQVCSSSVRRKRSRTASTNEVLKRKNRRRQLVKVLESTAMVSVPVICGQLGGSSCSSLGGLGEIKFSEAEANEEWRSFSSTINNSPDSTAASLGNLKTKDSDYMSLADNESSEILYDVPFIVEDKNGAGMALVDGTGRHPNRSCDVEVSKEWQLKRKRNSRNPSQNKRQDSRKYVQQTTLSSHYPGWNATRSDWAHVSPFDSSELYDVKLEQATSPKPQGVPMVQLTSRLSAKPIVGHPITIETLPEGTSGFMLRSSRKVSNVSYIDMINGSYPTQRSTKPKRTTPMGLTSSKSRTLASKSSSKKSRKSSSTSKKTKKLSSLTKQKQIDGGKQSQVLPKKPVVACIPVKLVFSRLNEALNGTAKHANRTLPTAST